MARIFITGHNGFIGTHIVQRLHQDNELVFLEGDLRDYQSVDNQLQAANPEIIVHLGARTEVEKSFYEQVTFSEINYVGTVNLIESARKLPNLRNFVFASTVEVYGWQEISDQIKDGTEQEIVCFNEETTAYPNAPYAVAKFACEKYLEYAHRSYGFPYTIIRQTNAYGRKDNDFFVTEQIITQMLKNSDEINLGYDKPFRSFIYIDDLMDAWQTVITNPDKCIGQLFCLGPNDPIRISDYVDLIAKKIGWTGTVNWNTKPARPGEIYLLNTSNEKITRMTGWEPKVSLSDGLDRTIDFWRTHLNVIG
jgi:nucleoside-diphosphate-sugar epimerase